ncbi:hypothetical protein D3C81_1228520 [compost metagenome]
MPNRPITATRKSKPRSSSCEPKVMRSVPETVSMPTAARIKPRHIAIRIFGLDSLPMPTKLQNVSRYTAKNSGGPKRSANFATIGARKVISSTPASAPRQEPVKAEVSALPASPRWAIG